MFFNEVDTFCESKLYGECPEWINIISSFIFCLISIKTVYKMEFKVDKLFFNLFYILFFIIGIGSACYHMFCVSWAKAFDETSMLISTSISIYSYIEIQTSLSKIQK